VRRALSRQKWRFPARAEIDIVTPTGIAIATNVSCKIEAQESLDAPTSLMVTGRNASGKSSMARVMAGLWPHKHGQLSVPTPKGSSKPGIKVAP
jgi:ABC-type uncharacterized transport system fused permease/ATPase subunit